MTTQSLWLREAHGLQSSSPLPDAVDVAIVGGGIAGISTSLHLAERGVRAAVLERTAVASRASGRNDGQLLLGLGEHYHRIHGQFGAAQARLLWDFLRENHATLQQALADHGVACDLAAHGGLRLAETAHEWSELQEAAALLQAEGRPHELVPPRELGAWLPLGVGYHGALHLVGEAILQPAAMVRGLAAAAQRAGAAIVEGAEVAAIDGEAGAFTVRLCDGRRLTAALVVHCTSTLARTLDSTGLLARTVFPFRGQVLATDVLPVELTSRFPPYAMSSNFCYEYFRIHRGRFVLGGMRWSVPGEELGLLDDDATNPVVTAKLLDYARRHFPAIAAHPFPHAWTGIMAGTPDGLPLVGALPGRPGTFALCAFNGYGLSFAFLAAHCLAEMLVEGRSMHPALTLFAPDRCRDR